MNLIRAILLLIIFITPLKANTIYNLIKIPNLEIYEINTKNKLKYFYAVRPFRLGTQKSVVCSDSNKKDLDYIRKNSFRKYFDFEKEIKVISNRNNNKLINLKKIKSMKTRGVFQDYIIGRIRQVHGIWQ